MAVHYMRRQVYSVLSALSTAAVIINADFATKDSNTAWPVYTNLLLWQTIYRSS